MSSVAARFPHRLLDGYKSFVTDSLPSQSERYRELAETGQSPETLVIACCDSRAAPETIFDASPGEIFVLRNVANLVPPYLPDGEFHGTSAAIEFAVLGLKVKNIVVMGHARCGGVIASLAKPGAAPLSESDFIGQWITLLAPTVDNIRASKDVSEEDYQLAVEREAVMASIANLRSFPFIKEHEDAGNLGLHGAWFDISSGELWCLKNSAETSEARWSPALSDV